MPDPIDEVQRALRDRYAVERPLGEGGMATVYLAEDLKHDRRVAVKVLRPELAAVVGAERFLREIKTTANLQHPHILPLFDSGEAGSLLFYVMPFVEGESLRNRLEREKQLGVEESVRLTSEVASALDYAHRHGVIHRDIKPANILLHDGSALVSDFGVALAVRSARGERITETGLSLGTPHYMSPEQATGDRHIGARSDVYSLAAVLYEMLAGEPPHSGGTIQAILAKVLTEPVGPLDELRPSVPEHVAEAVERALSKVPADRFATAAEFAEALRNPVGEAPRSRATTLAGGPGAAPQRITAAVVGVTALVLGGAAGWLLHRPPTASPPQVVRFEIQPDSGQVLQDIPAVSPDGTTIVYEVSSAGSSRLMVRRMDDTEARPLPGSEGGYAPFFSPDGAWVAFAAGSALKRTRLDGGTPTPITTLGGMFAGGSWGADNTIVYAAWPQGRLFRIPSGGGPPTPVVLADSTIRAMWPVLVSDGRTLLFQAIPVAKPEAHTVALDLAAGTLHDLGPKLRTRFARPDALVYATAGGRLLWQPFEFTRYDSIGPSVQIAANVAVGRGFGVSEGGAVVYMAGVSGSRTLLLADRHGVETPLASGPGIWAPRFSPDGRRVAYGAYPQGEGEADIWIRDLSAGASQRLTYQGRDSNDPAWSPDGRRIAFSAVQDSLQEDKDLFVQDVDGSPNARPLVVRPGMQWTSDWSRDGSTILYTEVSSSTGDDIWSAPEGGGEPTPFLVTPFAEEGARLSPDGRWVAYTSNETGRDEVYVQSFPTPGNRIVVSENGGRDPAWRGDGRELYYWHLSQLVAAELTPGTPLEVTRHEVLFSKNYLPGIQANYDVAADGQRFVIVTGGASSSRLTVVLNAVGRAP